MTKEELEKVIEETFFAIEEVFKTNKEQEQPILVFNNSHLIFPKKRRNRGIRVSEQELRFIFVEKLNQQIKDKEVYYSVETPTEHAYKGFKEGTPEVADNDINARSGNIDLCIHNKKGERICLIEFKALNPKAADYSKDFVKLINEAKENEKVFRFFLQIIDSVDDQTIENIATEKFRYFNPLIDYKCYSIDPKRSGNIEKDILNRYTENKKKNGD